MSITTIVACLVYAFINSWKLTLVVLAIIPFLVVASAIQMKFFAGGAASGLEEDDIVQSGKVSFSVLETREIVDAIGIPQNPTTFASTSVRFCRTTMPKPCATPFNRVETF